MTGYNKLSSFYTQFHPPKPGFTEKDAPDLGGKVYIVTGSSAGIGKELARMLYSRNAKVYIAARSPEKAEQAITDIKGLWPTSKGELVFLKLDLNDLSGIKGSAQEFLAKEKRLDVLFNNAGINSGLPASQLSPQGVELNLATNCLGPHLFTKLLTPILTETAHSSPPDTVRVIWLSSFGKELFAAPEVGLPVDNLDYKVAKGEDERYSNSKVGCWAQAIEFGKRNKEVVSVPVNPGNLKSDLFKERGLGLRIVAKIAGYPVKNGAATQLYAGLNAEVTREKLGRTNWVIPFGRVYAIRTDLEPAVKSKEEGGTGGTQAFWEWCEEKVTPFV
ncbi:putative short-chain dehydrogenase [Cladorrhinum sp. PSN259]|nr:putative short-chain dehydrogenase [Cladorrhinum sp. PSN259]